MQLAGQIFENNIQELLVGSQYPKSENLVRNPEIFLTFFYFYQIREQNLFKFLKSGILGSDTNFQFEICATKIIYDRNQMK